MATTKNGWTITRDTTTGNYTLEKAVITNDDQTILVKCGNKNMTGDLRVNVGVRSATYGATLSQTLSGTQIIITPSVNVSQSGWVQNGKTGTSIVINATDFGSAVITPTVTNSGLSTYFNNGTAGSYDVYLVPKYKNSAGYMDVHTSYQSGTTLYYKIKQGTEGVPQCTVSSSTTTHKAIITPRVSNEQGWIAGSTLIEGTSIEIKASDLVSGSTLIIQQSGQDVTNYASVNVQSGSALSKAEKGMVSNNEIIITPKLTKTDGWINGGTVNGDTIKVSASDLVDGVKTINFKNGEILDQHWQSKNFNINIPYGYRIWTDGENTYYNTYQENCVFYIFNKETSDWEETNIYGKTYYFDGHYVWTDGENTYYNSFNNSYIFDKGTKTWIPKIWTGLTDFTGGSIWTDGTNIYCSFNTTHKVLDKATSTWSDKTWYGLTNFDALDIWTDGTNIYYSHGENQYVLNKATSTWSQKTWYGLTEPNAGFIWTDGKYTYHSSGGNNYKLNGSTWENASFTINLSGFEMWTDGTNIYNSFEKNDNYYNYKLLLDQVYTNVTNYRYADVQSATYGATLIQGTVSNHQVVITPSVSVSQAGWVQSGKTGTAITISASDLVSGTIAMEHQIENVTNYAMAEVIASSYNNPVATKGSVSSNKVVITPSIQITGSGWIDAGTITGSSITVKASDLVSGTVTPTGSGVWDCATYSQVNIQDSSFYTSRSVNPGSVSRTLYYGTSSATIYANGNKMPINQSSVTRTITPVAYAGWASTSKTLGVALSSATANYYLNPYFGKNTGTFTVVSSSIYQQTETSILMGNYSTWIICGVSESTSGYTLKYGSSSSSVTSITLYGGGALFWRNGNMYYLTKQGATSTSISRPAYIQLSRNNSSAYVVRISMNVD